MQCRTCCFTGHRKIEWAAYPKLRELLAHYIESLLSIGCTEFVVGGALGFDTLAAECVLAAKETHPECRLHLVLPCRDQERFWSARDAKRYRALLASADLVDCLHERYVQGCMHERNRAMIDMADVCLAYCTTDEGGSAYTCRYAEQRGVRVINLAQKI